MFATRIGAVIALAASATGTVGQEGEFEPIPGFVSVFLQEQFDMVPAPSISARMPNTTCRKDVADEPFPGYGEEDFVGAYYCMIDYGCGQVSGVPVWFEADDDLWFGPDSAGRLAAMHCANSITNEARREHFSNQIDQGG